MPIDVVWETIVHRIALVAFIAFAVSSNAFAKSEAIGAKTPVFMTSYNALDNTFNGYLHVEAAPCGGRVTYEVNLVFSGSEIDDPTTPALR